MNLEFIRLTTPEQVGLIPPHLIEQVKDDGCDVNRFYKSAKSAVTNPFVGFYVLVDKACVIKGVLWYSLDDLEAVILVHFLSIDKEYQFSDVFKDVFDLSKKFEIGPDFNGTIRIITTRPKGFEKLGFKRSNKIIMEIYNGNDNQGSQKRDESPDTAESTEP